MAHQVSNLLAFIKRVASKEAVLERILISQWRARLRPTAMHAASLYAANRRRPARRAGPRFGAATRARKHRARVALVGAGHFFFV